MVQHVTLGRLWSASKVWQRDLEPVSSRLKALCEFQAVPSCPKLWSPCEKPLAGLHQGPGPRTLARGEEREHLHFCYFPRIISEGVRTIDVAWKWLEDSELEKIKIWPITTCRSQQLWSTIDNYEGQLRSKFNRVNCDNLQRRAKLGDTADSFVVWRFQDRKGGAQGTRGGLSDGSDGSGRDRRE
ncbi:hypothetical protein K438DRAFT_1775340 [Mycena galopus ATCC 62051]|nr:hypothetical protein K438DRAFT_1775340 [Mycena galopus ATCC 62051]